VRLAIRLLLIVYTDVIEYIVSPNRYDIFEDYGPYASCWITLPAFFLFFLWPVAIGVVSLFYGGEYSYVTSALGTSAHYSQSWPFARSISADVTICS